MYTTGAVLCFAQLTDLPLAIAAPGFAFCTAAGVYVLDRAKVRDAWLDPADAEAQPERFAFVHRHRRGLRWMTLGLFVGAAALGERLVAGGAAAPVVAGAGVVVYAGRPRARRSRPKDVFILKGLYVALGITGFAALVTLAGARPGGGWGELASAAAERAAPLGVAGALLAARVFADAALCDLDDERADRRFGTATLPTRFGREPAWRAAYVMRLLVAGALVIAISLPLAARLAWAVVTAISTLVLRASSPAHVRDWVDLRLPLESLAVGAILLLVQ